MVVGLWFWVCWIAVAVVGAGVGVFLVRRCRASVQYAFVLAGAVLCIVGLFGVFGSLGSLGW